MLIPASANPGEGLAVGQRPAMKIPLLLKEPKHVFPPPQLAIVTPRTNAATGTTTSQSFHRNIEHSAMMRPAALSSTNPQWTASHYEKIVIKHRITGGPSYTA
jgi:hypothetical protein